MSEVAALAGVLVALAALIVAGRANSHAKRSNEKAEVANNVAKDALAQAREANRIAEDANQLSQDANTLVERTVTREEEDWLVDWRAEWEKERSVLVLMNKGRDPARDITVVIYGKDIHDVHSREEDLPAGEELTIPLDQVREQRVAAEAENRATAQAMRAQGYFWGAKKFVTRFDITITWRTGAGFPDRRTIELKAS